MPTKLDLHVCALIGAALLLTASMGPHRLRGEGANEDEHFAEVADAIWQWRLQQDPLLATSVGDARYNDRLPEVSLEAAARWEQKTREQLAQLRSIDADKLSATQRVNYQILLRTLANDLAESQFHANWIPITNRSGFHISFPDLRDQVPLRTVNDYDNYIARLNGFRDYVRGHVELMRQGIQTGYTLPGVVLSRYADPIEAHIVEDPQQSLFFEPLKKLPDSFSPPEQHRLRQAAKEAIERSIVPGYEEFLRFMKQEYVPNARGSLGASALPHGREFYRHRVRRFTTLDVSPEEVHEIGKREVARIRGEMLEIVKQVGFSGSLAEFIEDLRSDERFHPRSPKHLMQEVALILKRMDGQLPELFGKLPRTPYGLKPIPDYIAPATTSAYYMPPPGDGSRAGFYFINTYDLKSRPLYEMEALSLHEAVPGHHLQLALQQEMSDLPAYRRFSNFTVFIEGWALYAERLGREVGFYEDPYSDFGRLTFEMWRACRLVVDTGIHYLGWTRQQAIDYMAANTALSLHNIRAEVDRYIAWPGQALAYKMGELKIRELRKQAESTLGNRFDIRDFHDTVLAQGSVPLEILEQSVQHWIESRRQETADHGGIPDDK